MFEEKLQQAFANLQIPCTSDQAAQCARYFAMLVEANQTMNLTNVTQEDEAILLHFCDSARLLPVFPLPKGVRCIDVGTGAGFPGMVLAILRPDLSITLMDSLQKRVLFLQRVVEDLGLANVRCVHARAEQASHDAQHRARYDFAFARAVASLPTLAEYCLPFVRTGGYMVAYKGPQGRQECSQARTALRTLGGQFEKLVDSCIPGREHTLIFIKKTRATPQKYPRKAGIPTRQPL